MLSAPQLQGCYVALISPMTVVGRETVLDIPAYRNLLTRVIDAGCTGVIVSGTTGQSPTLTTDEKVTLVQEACSFGRDYAAAHGRKLQVIAAAGSNATHSAVMLTKHLCAATELDALLHVTGYYNNPPQEGLRRHFEAVADAAAEFDKSVILYNVPGRTKSNLEAKTAIALSKHPAIVGLKEASGDLGQVRAICEATYPGEFVVLSGEDALVAPIMAMGGTGVISATANVWPREFQVLCDLMRMGLRREADELQAALLPTVKATFAAKNPIPLHHMLDSRIRLPLVEVMELDEPTRSQVLETIKSALAIQEFPHVDVRHTVAV